MARERWEAAHGAAPAALDSVIIGVLGLDDRPQAWPAIRFAAGSGAGSGSGSGSVGSGALVHSPPQVAAAYGFPDFDGGAGRSVGIVELAGGYSEADLATYFWSLSISPAPSITAVAVDGAANSPGTDPDADGEVALDIEVIGAIIPRAAIVARPRLRGDDARARRGPDRVGDGVPDRAGGSSSGRGVPDVASDADTATGDAIRVGGAPETVGGTSAVAPLWAALVVLLAEALGAPLGIAQPRLYPLLGSAAFHDITQGSNGAYSAGPG